MSDFESGAFNRALPPLRSVFNYLRAAILVQLPKRVQPSKSLSRFVSRCEPRRYIPGIHNGTKFCHGWVKVPPGYCERPMPQHLRRLRQIAGRIHQIGPEGVAGRVQHQILGPALRAAEGTRGLETRSGMSPRRVGVAVGFCLVLSGADRT